MRGVAGRRRALRPAASFCVRRARAAAFAVGDRVRTRRHGPAEVVAVDALGVTVAFANGQQRSFLPQFLAHARARAAMPPLPPLPPQ